MEATFKERIRASVENLDGAFAGLIVEPLDDWLKDVVRARNSYAHHGADFRLNGSVGEHRPGEQLYWLFAMNLLREAGADEAAFDGVGKHPDMQWLVDQARTSCPRSNTVLLRGMTSFGGVRRATDACGS